MPLTTKLAVSLQATLTKALDLATGSVPLSLVLTRELADGTGAGQANRVWSDTRTLAASASETLDLAGTLTDAFGDAFTLARVKMLAVIAKADNANNVVVGGASSNAWVGPFAAANNTVQVRPNGMLIMACQDATGWAVTAGTGDLLQIANGGSGTSVTYDIVIIGASA